MESQKFAIALGRIAALGGRELAVRYRAAESSGLEVSYKDDASPVTEADLASHVTICSALFDEFPDIPILSEEGEHPVAAVRRQWSACFLLDPLDGTKGFIRRTGDFCVSLAYVVDGVSVIGAIHSPLQDFCMVGGRDLGVLCAKGDGPYEPLSTMESPREHRQILVMSRIRRSDRMQHYIQKTPHGGVLHLGSALKFCWLATRRAHVYPCFHPTWEWDTAAGQAIVEAAGGGVADMQGVPLRYNKSELQNPWFVARSG